MDFDKLTNEVSALCEVEKIEVKYTDEGDKRIFRFNQGEASVVKIIDNVDLVYKTEDTILYEIRRAIDKLLRRAAESVK